MTNRFLYFNIINWFEVWVGYENDEGAFEFRIEIGFYKLWFSFPIRWIKNS